MFKYQLEALVKKLNNTQFELEDTLDELEIPYEYGNVNDILDQLECEGELALCHSCGTWRATSLFCITGGCDLCADFIQDGDADDEED